MRKVLPLLGGLGVIVSDLLSKEWATSQGFVSINPGVSFGLGEGSSPAFMVVLITMGMAVIGWWASREWTHWHWSQRCGVALLLGGGCANLVDRLLSGGVRDWLSLGVFQIQNNLADWAIALGITIWMGRELQQLLMKKI